MSALTDLLSMALLGIGTLFLLIGGTGLLRLPDVFTRLHGASVTDTRRSRPSCRSLTAHVGRGQEARLTCS